MKLLRAILVGLTLISLREARGTDYAWDTERWTTGDTVRQGTLITLQIIDWRQTRWFVKNPIHSVRCTSSGCTHDYYSERNPILGPHPSVGRVNNLIGASIVGHALISSALSRRWREPWQYVWIGMETNAVIGNYKMLGVKAIF